MMHRNESDILAQKPNPAEPGNRLRWVIILSSLPLFGIVAAFGIAPDTRVEEIPAVTVVDRLELSAAQILATPAGFWHEERVQRGDNISRLLNRLQVDDPAAITALLTAKGVKAPRQLVPGRAAQALTSEDGELVEFRYLAPDGKELVVKRNEDGFDVSEQPAALETRVHMSVGEIDHSLFGATDAAGVPDSVAIQMADIFASEIDFHRDIRSGDRFTVVYEVSYSRGEPVSSGRVLAAEFVNDGKAYRAVYFRAPDGRGGYYAPDGKNLRKAFLRSPLEFSRISSGFTSRRYHPVLKEWRAHRGIDYAAPTGTRVRATADGWVDFIGRQGGYGNLVVLRHAGRVSTAYGHLSKYAGGLRRGSRVNQGEIIGYVGSTGLATGPHLHYEFRVDGAQRNPLAVAMPAAEPVAPEHKAAFSTVAAEMNLRLALTARTQVASAE